MLFCTRRYRSALSWLCEPRMPQGQGYGDLFLRVKVISDTQYESDDCFGAAAASTHKRCKVPFQCEPGDAEPAAASGAKVSGRGRVSHLRVLGALGQPGSQDHWQSVPYYRPD